MNNNKNTKIIINKGKYLTLYIDVKDIERHYKELNDKEAVIEFVCGWCHGNPIFGGLCPSCHRDNLPFL